MRSAAAATPSASSPTAPAWSALVGAVLAEQHDQWTEQRHYIGLDVLTRSDPPTPAETDTSQEVNPEADQCLGLRQSS